MRLRPFAAALFWIAAPLLAGCFRTSTLVKLNPDGSGTIELATTVRPTLSSVYDPRDPYPFPVSDAMAAAGEMGSGVTIVSATKIDTPDWVGIKAVYAFKDIRTVSLGQLNEPAELAVTDKSARQLAFAFTRLPNGNSLLTIDNNVVATTEFEPDPPAETKAPKDGTDEKQMLDWMTAALGGTQIDFAIEVGHLVRTNLPFVNSSRVTLLSLDFDQVVANSPSMEKFLNAYYSEGDKALQGVKGIQIIFAPKLTLEFRK